MEQTNVRKAAESTTGSGKLPDNFGAGIHYYARVPDPDELRKDRRGD